MNHLVSPAVEQLQLRFQTHFRARLRTPSSCWISETWMCRHRASAAHKAQPALRDVNVKNISRVSQRGETQGNAVLHVSSTGFYWRLNLLWGNALLPIQSWSLLMWCWSLWWDYLLISFAVNKPNNQNKSNVWTVKGLELSHWTQKKSRAARWSVLLPLFVLF